MGTNDVELVRVWTKESGGIISDVTAQIGRSFEIVLEAEVRSEMIHASGLKYEFGFFIRDLSTPTTVVIYQKTIDGSCGDANWPDFRTEIVHTVPATVWTPDLNNHIMQVEAYLLTGGAGAAPPDVCFATSPKFIVHTP
jgi:hypothetical protein